MDKSIVDKLREISFFSNMSDFDLRQIAEIMNERSYEPGEMIIQERTEAERFFIVHRGKIEISKKFEGTEKAVLSIQSDGAFFGEMAILDEGRRSATVMALEPTTVLEIVREDFEPLLYKAPILAYKILKELSARLRETGALLISFLTQRNRQMYRAYTDTMTSIIHAVEERNALISGHNRRITSLALAIGREVGLDEEDLLILELSALLHDLGMIAMPESLLEKPGPLTEEEYRTIQTHTIKSAEMIVGIALLGRAIPSIMHHHERFDGSGYPNGLSGTDIPFLSRIVSIADAFVAMTRDRPYRPRLTDDEATAEILKGAGSQFDPNVVAAFEKLYKAGAVSSI